MTYKPQHTKNRLSFGTDWVLVCLVGLDTFLMTLVICLLLFIW